MKRVAIIGYGAIARAALKILAEQKEEGPKIVGLLEKKERSASTRSALGGTIPVVEPIEELLALNPDWIAEAASREALHQYGQTILEAGKDL